MPSATTPSLGEMTTRLLRPAGQGRAARTVELFGWLCLVEGTVLLLAPRWVEGLFALPSSALPGFDCARLVALLVSGIGMLYVVSGRLDAQGFVFASLLDRPLVPPLMALLWYLDMIPASLALVFSIQDFFGFLWTLSAWRADARTASSS
jgi:hypothetical protein